MKIFITIVFHLLIFINLSIGQIVNLPMIISNGNTSDTLYFGVNSLATDGIDTALGEQELPPFPPQDVFDIRFISDINLPIPIGEGLKKDYRFGIHQTFDTIQHKIRYQIGTGSTIRFDWSFPFYVSVRLIDDFSGVLLNVILSGSGNYTIPQNLLSLQKLNFIVYYDPILPVELISFSSTVIDNNVKLFWETDSEKNNAGFEIQRKKIDDIGWTVSGFVNGAGTSNKGRAYEFTDRNLQAGKYNYRLKQIDLNGNFEFFTLNEIVNVQTPDDLFLSQNYPNPFNPSTTIKFKLPSDSHVRITLYDESGKLVKNLLNEFKTSGYYELNFTADNLSSGVYYYSLENDNKTLTRRMVILK